jgi:parallel beta-helix repeat protein
MPGGDERSVIELKKPFLVLFVVSLLLTIASVTHMNAYAEASPKTINVPQNYHTIQEAINNAMIGEVILVQKGTYHEDIQINKTVSLRGEGPDLTTIEGNVSLYVVSVTADGVSIEGFTILAENDTINPVIFQSTGNTLSNNVIENGYYGVVLSASAGNMISDNIISGNTYGVEIRYSTNNVFSDNVVADQGFGIDLYFSNDNIFRGNTISENLYGISLYDSSTNNIFYHNNFINNTNQLSYSESASSTNVWSLNGEGNYWSDYVGQDLIGDGIGDSPYNHTDTEEGDSYPLMGPFYNLGVVLGNTTYGVNLISNSSISGFKYELGEETGNRILLFNAATREGAVGFCRIMIPVSLMEPPLIVLGPEGEITPKLLSASNETNTYLYFTWVNSNQTISIIYSEAMGLYDELLGNYTGLLSDFHNLSATNSALLENYSALLNSLLQLQNRYFALNASYNEHLSDYSKSVENFQNLLYIFAATTAIFLVAIAYLSKRASTSIKQRAIDSGKDHPVY